MAWGVNNNGWWGEGEIKFFMDGDGEYPTICGTGTEDYFCGSYDFEDPVSHDHYRALLLALYRPAGRRTQPPVLAARCASACIVGTSHDPVRFRA